MAAGTSASSDGVDGWAAREGGPRHDAQPPPAPATRIDSLHTRNFPDLLHQLGGSLLVATGGSGRLIVLYADGAAVGTHAFGVPCIAGIAADGARVAVAASPLIVEFHNLPDVARHLHDPPRHDAVYLARRSHVTGAVGIRDMAWDGRGELWLASTLLSSLCTLDAQSALVPRWRPHFVGRCVSEDRCHLNGIAVRDGHPRYVTALGATDTAQGWRATRHAGGVLVDCGDECILAHGLSLPHSPRWHDGRLWLLEAGRGALVTVDPQTGRKTDVAHVPGYARGLGFLGPVAFVGVSRPREGGAVADTTRRDRGGVWAVHIDSGRTLALLEFSGDATEVHAVQALPGVRFPGLVHGGDLLSFSYALPPQALRDVDPALFGTPEATTR